jgi:hypothetical protein
MGQFNKESIMVFNGAQFHLFVNHLPVIGFVFALVGLLVASFMKSVDVKRFVLGLTVIAGLSSLPAFWTGEPAEEVVEDLQGVSEALIEEHEESAEVATILAVISALVAAGALLLHLKNPTSITKTFPAVVVVSSLTLLAMGKAAHEGGKIRHPEIRSEQSAQNTGDGGEEAEDDD